MSNTLNNFKVTDRQTFIQFLDLLRQDFLNNPNSWENKTLPGFLEALSAYTNDIGFLTEKSVINDFLAKKFPDVVFEESDADLDHSGDIDYIGKVGDKAFGIQIKPVTANSNFGNYNLSERMQANFESFEEKYGGKVFIIFSTKVGNKKEVKNKEVLDLITAEIARLK
jgi:hypothetical protein